MATKKASAKPATKTAASAAKAPKAPKAAKAARPAHKVPSGPKERLAAKHGGKDALIKSIIGTVSTEGQDGDALTKTLTKVSNAKLLRLVSTVEAVTKKYGSRSGLVEAILKAQKRGKDKEYSAKLSAMPLPKLLDLARSAI